MPFTPGRTDASQEQTDVESFAVLEPTADGFRNYMRAGDPLSPETRLLDRANLLNLTAPEMTVLVGGMRALNANFGQSRHGVFTGRPETLTNDFFVNLLDIRTAWRPSASTENVYEGRDRATGELKWTATAADLVFGAHSQLRALAVASNQSTPLGGMACCSSKQDLSLSRLTGTRACASPVAARRYCTGHETDWRSSCAARNGQ